jgi:hypothetical protein
MSMCEAWLFVVCVKSWLGFEGQQRAIGAVNLQAVNLRECVIS